jgi:WD40 repeat protein
MSHAYINLPEEVQNEEIFSNCRTALHASQAAPDLFTFSSDYWRSCYKAELRASDGKTDEHLMSSLKLRTRVSTLECSSNGVFVLGISVLRLDTIDAHYNTTIQVWDSATGLKVHNAKIVMPEFIFSAKFHPTLDLIAFTSGTQIHTWNFLNEPDVLENSWDHSHSAVPALFRAVYVAFDPEGVRIASGGGDDAVRIWDRAGTQQFPEMSSPIQQQLQLTVAEAFLVAVCFSPNNTVSAVYVYGEEEVGLFARVWNLNTGRPVLRYSVEHTVQYQSNVSFSPNGSKFAVFKSLDEQDAGTIFVIDLIKRSSKEIKTQNSVTKVKFGGDDTTLLTAFHEPSEDRYENILCVWNLSESEATKVAHKLRVGLVVEGNSIFGFCAHGNAVAWGNQIGAVFIADLNTKIIR